MTSGQTALLKKAKESIEAAALLAKDEYYDFAVSRAYYAMFYIAEAFLLGQGLSFSKHSAVIAAFGEKFVKTGIIPEEFHQYLIESQEQRNIGDYQYDSEIPISKTIEQIQHAEQFLKLAQQHLDKTNS